MTDSGFPPSTPDDPAASRMGPRPRVEGPAPAAGPAPTTGPAPGLARSGGLGSAGGSGGGAGEPPQESFWRDGDDDSDDGPQQPRNFQTGLRVAIEWTAVAIGALAVALVIKAFLLQAFYIPTASMDPTLAVDDRVLVNKLSYQFGSIQRGDIVVFSRPEGAPGDIDDFIKRVIALPGETVSFSEGEVFINGQRLDEPYVDGAITTNASVIEGCANSPSLADTCSVPDGMIFVMGDNRQFSVDSRRFGPIDEDSVVGRAFLKVWPLGDIGFL